MDIKKYLLWELVEGARASWEQKSQKMMRLHATTKASKGRVDNCDAIFTRFANTLTSNRNHDRNLVM
jgi:hypothetical protein